METQLLIAILIACAVSYTEGQSPVPTALNTTITNTSCGGSKLCVSYPAFCNPTGNSSCFFASSSLWVSGTLFFELSGTTSGYVGLGLGTNQTQGPDIVFVCGNSNNSFFFQTDSYFNKTAGLTPFNVSFVSAVQGAVSAVNQSIVQCTFNITTDQTSKAASALNTTTYVTLYQGNVTGSQLGVPNEVFKSNILNLTDPTSNLINTTTTATPTVSAQSTTKAGNNSAGGPCAHGLVILLSAITFRLLH